MRTTILLIAAFIFSLGFTSCSKNDDEDQNVVENPLADYNLLTSFKSNGHDIQIYSDQEQFTVGYNELFIRIKDDDTDAFIKNADISWKPLMHMTGMMHGCPASAIETTEDTSVYSGYLVFQMPGNADEYWDLTLDYKIDGLDYSTSARIDVNSPADGKRRVNSFMGSDDVRYVLAMLPMEPKEGVNNFASVLYKMEDMITFTNVAGYKVTLDPRMPGMGNHSSPNNEVLTYDTTTKTYQGKLNFTMTGYWKINLELIDENGETLKGNGVAEENESSSLFFEIEF
ncbi:hypothetical protein K8352_16425 [Flavobacteriaceae bacterium F89]|uniref:YtkA-like domain-containing protein n=1 Tax=Cerina litoralis TaxID=2874477 RepID=A0AAE3EY03_9FLAO|nr:hypothetical protein [Cerina litoralis]MCG2462348.1 hypothetical protein [Cerina litoralis]